MKYNFLHIVISKRVAREQPSIFYFTIIETMSVRRIMWSILFIFIFGGAFVCLGM